ncbi:MCE family protein [Massilia arenosa]|uniref:MCE family protein n=1 Tax=Zemynaea arenosa TaxID=2561931 RepID=A0A4Y9SLJ1_9BURK|nr:MlaD family protein [Massilia arenosa]TFW22580.1 MCE family protein [Massilia arenosa]
MENRSHALMTGFFTIALVLAAILAGFWFNHDSTKRVPYVIATTQSIPGLNPQATVRYRGLEVGKVDTIDFNPRKSGEILISLLLDPDTPVTTSTYASLGYQGVTGIAYIQLDDERTGSPLLKSDKDRVAAIPLRPGFLDQLEKRGKAILELAESFSRRANEALGPENQAALKSTLKNMSEASERIAQIPDELEPAIKQLPELTRNANRAAASVAKAADDYDKLAVTLNSPEGPIARLTTTVDKVSGSVEGIAANIELQTLPHIVSMADEAKTSLRAVKRTVNTISDRPQSLLFGSPSAPPGPGEPGFAPPPAK